MKDVTRRLPLFRKLAILTAVVVLWSVTSISTDAWAAPGARERCKSDFAKLADQDSNDESLEALSREDQAEQEAAIRWLRQSLFEPVTDEQTTPTFDNKVQKDWLELPKINGGVITGPNEYRLLDVKKHLGLTEDYMHRFPSDASVLSVGEGVSELAANLRVKFPKTNALDLWYHDANLPKNLANFVALNRPHLIAGSSTNMPVVSGSVDLVVSHMLLSNLYANAQLKSIREMIRVLKVGGEAKIAFADDEKKDLVSVLQKLYGSEISVSAVRWKSDWKSDMVDVHGQTLTIRRLRKENP